MKYQKVFILSAFFVLLFVAGAFGVAGFQTKTALADDCGVTSADIAQITAIQNNPNLTSSQELTEELALRKQLVGLTITCAEQEVQTLQINLQNAPTSTQTQVLESQLAGDLNDASNFYTIELTKLNGVGIAGSEAIAGEVFSWRQSTFAELSENINNYILWSQNQSLFDTAETRMNQTQRAVSFLEGASPNPDLQTAFDAAASSFSTAQSENAEAKAALAEGLSPDQSLLLIQQSLASLATTYQNFSTVGEIINTILPQ
jgi:hypothetical protein